MNQLTATPIADHSLAPRIVWGLMAIVCLLLVSMVDPQSTGILIGTIKIPLLMLYIWTALCGCCLSYQHRHKKNRWLEVIGLLSIALICLWFYNNLQNQFLNENDIDILLPTTLLLAGLFAGHSFELRSRFDFNFSLCMSLLLVFMTCTLGSGFLFGFLVFCYLCIAAVLAVSDSSSRLSSLIQAGESNDAKMTPANFVSPTIIFILATIGLFIMTPRAESIADEITAQIYYYFRKPDSPGTITASKTSKSTSQTSRIRRIKTTGRRYVQNNAAKAKTAKNGSDVSGKLPANGQGKAGKAPDVSGESIPDPKTGARNKGGSQERATAENTSPDFSSPSGNQKTRGGKRYKRTLPKPGESQGLKDSNFSRRANTPGFLSNSGNVSDDEKILKAAKPAPPPKDSLAINEKSPQADTVLFHVIVNRTVFFKQICFDYFDGQQWTANRQKITKRIKKDYGDIFQIEDGADASRSRQVPTIKLVQKYQIKAPLGDCLLTAGVPLEIDLPGQELTLDSSGTLKGSLVLVPKLQYKVISELPIHDLATLRNIPPPSEKSEIQIRKAFADFLQLPSTQSDDVYELAEQICKEQNSWFGKSEHIADYLKSHCRYVARTTLEPQNADQNYVDKFLIETNSGDCKDFASAFVVLCRSAGIPARLVAGYGPGTFNPISGSRQVRKKDAHAWGEVYVPDAGWVPFDATPQGTMPARKAESERYFSSLQDKVKQAITNSPDSNVQASTPSPSAPPKEVVQLQFDLFCIVVAVLIFAILGGPTLITLRALYTRFQSYRSMHKASKIYCGVLKELRRLDIAAQRSETAEELLHKLQETTQKTEGNAIDQRLAETMSEFMFTYNATLFGSKPQLNQLKNMSIIIKQLIRSRQKQQHKAVTPVH